jgi:hypothetical protein
MEKDTTFQGVMELLEDYVFTHFYPYLLIVLSKARAGRVEEFKTAQEIQRPNKKPRKVESCGQNGIQCFVPEVSGTEKISTN